MLDTVVPQAPLPPWLLIGAGVLFALWVIGSVASRCTEAALARHWLTFQDWSAVRLLPLPCESDRAAMLGLLRDFAPGRALAVYSIGDPPLLVAHRDGESAPSTAPAWIESHRAALSRGETVLEARCGTLVPVFTRAGLWRGVVLVADVEPVSLDVDAAASLRVLAATLEHAVLLTTWLHAHNVRDLRARLRATSA